MRCFSLALGLLMGCSLIVNGQLDGDCGDGTTQGGNREQCDDGNNNDGDGCSANCQEEDPLPETCGDGIPDPGDLCNFEEQEIPVGEEGQAPSDLLLPDLNGDGAPDAVVLLGLNQESSVAVLLNQKDATQSTPFALAQEIFVPTGTSEILVEDFGTDGLPDLVTVDEGIGAFGTFSGTGGAFLSQGFFTGDNLGTLAGAAAGDVDGDADADLIVMEDPLNAVVIVSSPVDSTVLSVVGEPFDVVDKPGAAALGDLNEDGLPDLVVASPEGGEIAIVENGPNGLPTGLVSSLSVEDGPITLLIEDFGRDGTPDLAVLDQDKSSVIIFSDPLGNLGKNDKRTIPLSDTPNAMVRGDIDQDDDQDLVVALDSGIEILINEQGVLTRARSIPLDDEILSIALGDINGDGALDIAAPLPDRNALVVLLALP